VTAFLALACALTWALDFPLAYAYAQRAEPPGYALALVGLGAWGPTFAAILVAGWRRELRGVFGRWRAHPLWIVAGLLYPAALHLPVTGIEWALGGQPAWFHPPNKPEYIAALIMFSFGEELGWRGFAYPRLAERLGPVVGSLILGAVWGVWHVAMLFTPEAGAPAPELVLQFMVRMALASVVIAWFYERSNRSVAVAIAIHAGAHLDNITRIPQAEVRLHILHLLALAVAALFAARSLSRPRVGGVANRGRWLV
jgi:membrane protease YdiL (CAAX protease family)